MTQHNNNPPNEGTNPVAAILLSTLQGSIYLEHGMAASGLTVRLYNRGFGGADTLLGETKTDAQGAYIFSYSTGGNVANLEVRVVGNDGKEVTISAPQYNPGLQKTLNLVAPASVQPLGPENQRLSSDLNTLLGPAASTVGNAQEDTSRQDLTFLAQSTGWDPRLIALFATASKLSATTNLGQDTLYALFRAGLPTDPQQLAWVDLPAVQKALKATNASGITAFSDQQIADAGSAFTSFALQARLAAQIPGTASSFGALLARSNLSSPQQRTFAGLYFPHPTSSEAFWQQVQASGFSQTSIDILRLQGKLAYLTLNNAGLTAAMQQEIGGDLAQLVNKDLYKPDGWKTRLHSLAGNNDQALQNLIPSTYIADGAGLPESLEAYANDLARKVRTSYPTQTVGRMLAHNELQINHGNDNQSVQAFLQKAVPLGFVLGQTSVDSFISANQAKVFPGATPDQIATTTRSVKTLHRLYQITPTNESLKVLLDSGFTSAHDIVAFPYDKFIEFYGKHFPSLDEAELVYRKSQQAAVVVHNFFSAALQITSNPPLFAISASQERRQAARDTLIEQYPTLSTLFGSLDFCECEHCNSVLGPAAYFVDLLQFLEHGQNDPHSTLWANFLNDWKSKHNNAPYPFVDQASWTAYLNDWRATHPNEPDPDPQKTPYTILTERRPDLPYLPLTCENTNTALPYIDIVNEILEYFIVHGGRLDQNAVYDTGNVTTADLLAEPQHILPAAYDTLKQAVYPLALPFDLWLETVRGFFDYYQMPFWQVLDAFRPSEELFAPQANAKSYYRASIFAESLGITPSEYALYTSATPLANWFALYGYLAEASALSALASAKTLSQGLGVSYKDVIALVQTNFINPQLKTLGILYKLGIPVEDVFRYEGQAGYQPFSSDEKTAFEQQLAHLNATFSTVTSGFDAKAWLNTAWQNGDFNKILVLYDADPAGNFDQTTLRYASGAAAENLVFLKMNLFVRLWKRLGWSMEEVDRALQVFLPRQDVPLTGANIGAAFSTVLLSIAHLTRLVGACRAGQNGRLQLLTLWSDLATSGPQPLYARLFLTKSILQNDLIFDHPLGLYLTYFDATSKRYLPFHWDSSKPEDPKTGNVSLKTHLNAVQGALGLSADEIGQILADTGKTLQREPLTLATLSLFYRYGLLAKGLGLSVKDVITLKGLCGLDPLKALNPGPVTQLAADYPLTQTLGFVDVVTAVKDSGFTVEDLNYLLRQRFDPVGKYRPDYNAVLMLLKSLAVGIRSIQSDNAVPTTASRLTDDFLRQKLALVLPSTAVDTFFALWSGAIDQVEAQVQTYFASYLQPFLKAGEFTTLFASLAPDLSDADKQTQMQARRLQFAQAFLPYLQQKLIRELVVSTLSTTLAADPALIEELLTDSSLLSDPTNPPAQGQPANPLLGAFTSSADAGVTVTYYASQNGSGPALGASTLAGGADTTDKPTGANSAHFEGYLEVPTNGAYRFFVQLDKKNAGAVFRLSSWPNPLLSVTATADNSESSQFIELKSALPYHFTLDISTLGGGDVSQLVQGENLPKGSLSRLTLYTQNANERIARVSTLLTKVLQVMQTFGFNAVEMRYLLTHPADFANLNLSALPTQAADDTPARAATLFAQFLRLARYANLKSTLGVKTEDLVDLFAHARLNYPVGTDTGKARTVLFADLCQRVADLTRRDATTVQAVASALGFTTSAVSLGADQIQISAPDFTQERGVMRLWNALQTISVLGISMDELARWLTPAPDFTVARDLRNTLKSHYEPVDWQRIARPIFDALRQRRRDVLVAFIMHQQGFARPEQLFEYFLIDPGMEPVVQTSRLVLATASVQTFVQRCLLNLEPEVNPLAIDVDQWQWMKHYRVWEANRKIFLFPENWLEPEFRDDKSSLFLDLESKLLQSDITNDLAEDAFFNYLKDLEALARLEIVSVYCDDQPDPSDTVVYVIGRTHNNPHKYFYRTYANQMWTPWVPITITIDGDHIVAVVWKQRLHLFWVTFMERAKQPDAVTNGQTYQDMGSKPIQEPSYQVDVQLSWSEYFQGKWSAPQTSGFGNLSDIGTGSFNQSDVYIYISKETMTDADGNVGDGVVNIHLGSPVYKVFRVVNKNSPPQVDPDEMYNAFLQVPYLHRRRVHATQYIGGSSDTIGLDVTYDESVQVSNESIHPIVVSVIKPILQQGSDYSLVLSRNFLQFLIPTGGGGDLVDFLTHPFFYQDRENTFFVEPTMTETTIDEWDWWVVPYPWPYAHLNSEQWWNDLTLQAALPVALHLPVVSQIDPASLYQLKPVQDWVTNPTTVLQYGDNFVGRSGGLTLVNLPARNGSGSGGVQLKPVVPGSSLGSIATLANGTGRILNSGIHRPGGVTIINQGGLTRGTLANMQVEQHLNENGSIARSIGMQ